ncbi:MAG TPA: N-acetylmuramoyl-L-alanine amidase [Pseudonocardiaceae bacterium]
MEDERPARNHLRRRLIIGGVAGTVAVAVVLTIVLAGPPNTPDSGAHNVAAATSTSLRITPAAGLDDGPVGPLDPSQFAPNACVAFAPTHGDKHKTVFLDAGHGGPDPGATGHTSAGQPIEEKQLTLPTVMDAAQQLEANGYRVVVSRTADTAIIPMTPADLSSGVESSEGKHADTIARITCANLAKAVVMISVHFDAFPSSSVTGALTFYDPGRAFSAQNQQFATFLQDDVVAALDATGTDVHNRGVESSVHQGNSTSAADRAYGRLLLLGPGKPGYNDAPSDMPGALTEPLFITNGTEGTLAASEAGQQAIASGILKAVNQFATVPD